MKLRVRLEKYIRELDNAINSYSQIARESYDQTEKAEFSAKCESTKALKHDLVCLLIVSRNEPESN